MHWFSKKRNFLIMMLPTLLIYIVYIMVPLFVAIYYSLTDFRGISAPNFIGLKNYIALFNDRFFLVSVKNTAIILVMSLVILLPASLALALVLNRKLKGLNTYKALSFLPNVIAPIVVGLIWGFVFDPEMGLINSILSGLGLESWQQQWIGGLTLTPYCVGIVYGWQNVGYFATIFVAGLKTIPEEIFEAARIDGATKWKQLIHVTIPMLKETIAINVVLIITGCFKIFEVVYQLTNGSPNHMSEVLTTYMYNVTFVSSKYGYGMSIAVFTCIVTMCFSLVYIYMMNRRKNRAGRVK